MSEADDRIKRARAKFERAARRMDSGVPLGDKAEDALWFAAPDLFAAVDERDALRKELNALRRGAQGDPEGARRSHVPTMIDRPAERMKLDVWGCPILKPDMVLVLRDSRGQWDFPIHHLEIVYQRRHIKRCGSEIVGVRHIGRGGENDRSRR